MIIILRTPPAVWQTLFSNLLLRRQKSKLLNRQKSKVILIFAESLARLPSHQLFGSVNCLLLWYFKLLAAFINCSSICLALLLYNDLIEDCEHLKEKSQANPAHCIHRKYASFIRECTAIEQCQLKWQCDSINPLNKYEWSVNYTVEGFAMANVEL